MIAKSAMRLHDLESPVRLELAAAQIRNTCSGVSYRSTWFVAEAGELWCNAVTDGHPVSVAKAGTLLQDARDALRELCQASSSIASLAQASAVRFAVVDDYGQGVAPLYCLEGDQLLEGDAAWSAWRRK